jgi:hypothetical protein
MEQSLPSSTLSSWGAACRPTLLFIAAYALSMTPHDAAHAFVAYLLGFSSTLFQLWVNPDAAQATTEQQALIAAAGPLFSVSVAAVCLMIYRKRRHKPATGSAVAVDWSVRLGELFPARAPELI